MPNILKQSTASQVIELGPFLDSTDFITAETGLTIANTDIRLRKHGGTSHGAKNSGGATHIANGYYHTTLDATDTNTVGILDVHVNVSGALPVWKSFQVVEEAIYDALFLAAAGGYATQASVDTIDDFLDTEIAAIKAKTDNLPEGIQKNTALSNFEFVMIDSSDHVSGKTGLTVTAQRSIDGGAFAACANSVNEVSAGVYKINLSAADLNGDVVTLKFTATGADTTWITVKTES